MTADEFRRIALGMKDAVEGAHMGHPDFRAHGRIFATLHGDLQWAMVNLTPEQQHEFMRDHPGAFVPEPGAWGRQGCTGVRLDGADEEVVGEAVTLAWRNKAALPVRTRRKTASTPARRSSRPKR
jgi:hypothetical protein